jgi:hypothetical protein
MYEILSNFKDYNGLNGTLSDFRGLSGTFGDFQELSGTFGTGPFRDLIGTF